jgi:hypothetical protein
MPMPTELLIDERAASLALDPAALRSWGQGQRVFVSSLISDMPEERRAVRDAIESVGAQPVMFEEELGAQDVSSYEAYLGGVRSSGIYVGLFGSRYGARTARGFSATEEEFREAERLGLRLCVFVNTDGQETDGAQRDLIDGARNLITTAPWSDPADLGRRVTRRLADLAAQELAPWVRLGDAVFRANSITSDGQRTVVQADIQDTRILARLNEIRDGRGSDLRFTSPDESRSAQVTSLSSSMTSTVSRTVTLTLSLGQPDQGMRMGTLQTNGVTYTAEEMVRLSMSDALFGTKTAPGLFGMSDAGDPLEPLRGKGVIDAVVRPVARLLITEKLLKRGDVSHVNSFSLGPARGGVRRARLTWTPARVYSNVPAPSAITIEGDIAGL